MTFSDKACIESENLAATLIHFDRGQKKAKEINLDTLDIPASQSTDTFQQRELLIHVILSLHKKQMPNVNID